MLMVPQACHHGHDHAHLGPGHHDHLDHEEQNQTNARSQKILNHLKNLLLMCCQCDTGQAWHLVMCARACMLT